MIKKSILGVSLVCIALSGYAVLPVTANAICSGPSIQVPFEECASLMQLYDESNGAQWTNNQNRGTDTAVGSRYGIDTQTVAGSTHVVGIDLRGNNLVGALYTSLENLPHLEDIDLSENQLTTLPTTIDGLTALRYADFSSMLLSSLPEQIGSLTELRTLDIRSNQINTLPTSFGQLDELDLLYAQQNNLSSLPASIAGLTELDYANFSNNYLTEFPDFGQGGDDLDILILDNNSISAISSAVGSLSTLDSLSVDNNGVSSLDSAIGGLSTLTSLNLDDNALVTLPSSIGSLSSLETLYLQDNQLEQLPEDLSGLTNLETLYLYNNNLTELSTTLGDITSLRYLYIYENEAVGTIPDVWGSLSALQRLYIFDNNLDRDSSHYAIISDNLLSWWSGIGMTYYGSQGDVTAPTVVLGDQLEYFTMDGSLALPVTVTENSYHIDGGGDGLDVVLGGSCAGASTSDIMTIDEETIVTVTFPSPGVYADCTLHIVDHGDNESVPIDLPGFVYGVTLADFCTHSDLTISQAECEALVALYESTDGPGWTNDTRWIEDPDVNSWYGIKTADIGGQEHVTGIFLHDATNDTAHGNATMWLGNNLSGVLPDELGNLTELTYLNLSRNNLLGTLPEAWSTMDSLETLYISETSLSGTIPSSWTALQSLRILIMRDNAFAGALPVALASMSSLEVIDLGGNNLLGTLPDEWTNIGSLRYVDLSNNRITGVLPESWSSMNTLRILDLADNMLVGALPVSRQNMSSLETLYLDGNAFNRDAQYRVKLPATLISRWTGLESKSLEDQDDITPPILTGTGTIPRLVSAGFAYTLTIDEQSFLVDNYGEGVAVMVSGSALCSTITTSGSFLVNGTQDFFFTVAEDGLYDDCSLYIQDHGGNTSEIIALSRFGKASGGQSICYDPGLSVSLNECLGLMLMYERTGGSDWTNNTGWGVSPNLSNWYGLAVFTSGSGGAVTGINLSANNLSGTFDTGPYALPAVEMVNISNNAISAVGSFVESMPALISIDMSNNNLSGPLDATLSQLDGLTTLYLSANSWMGTLPIEWVSLANLSDLRINGAQLEGSLPTWLGTMTSLDVISLANNNFIGELPISWSWLSGLHTLVVDGNNLDRQNDHTMVVPASMQTRYDNLSYVSDGNQGDLLSPEIGIYGAIPFTIDSAFTLPIAVEEGSYAVNQSGFGMTVSFSGAGVLCKQLSTPDTVMVNNGTGELLLVPGNQGLYENCILSLNDHAGNQGMTILPSFTYALVCGNGEIDDGEVCDEGRYCDDGTDCTDDISLCPTECSVRLQEGCNQRCQASECGDGFIDIDGLDNIPNNADDEICDEGRWCSNGAFCSSDPNLCPSGPADCLPRFTASCTPFCAPGLCGDGIQDVDGVDNIADNNDDEECDDGNYTAGDGCSNSCKLEYCGDGVLGPGEQCDEGANNGLLGGTCTSSCLEPDATCAFCYEVCDGGTNNHSLFMLIDVSGSMGSNGKLDKAKLGVEEFINLIEEKAATNTGFVTKVGIIGFSDDTSTFVAPTTNYASVITAVTDLTTEGGTNFGDPLLDAADYFAVNDIGYEQHIILLSDGLPTVTTSGLYDPEEWALYGATVAKNGGADIYTISVELTQDGVSLMREMSSSPIANVADGKSANQSSTNKSFVASQGVDALYGNNDRAETDEENEAWWEVDLGAIYSLDSFEFWNRSGSKGNSVTDYYIHISESPFASTDLQTTLDDPTVTSIFGSGVALRPSVLEAGVDGRYVRAQLQDTDHMIVVEFEALGCPVGASCTDVYSYEDYQGDAIELLYSHIFGAIHCGCSPEKICGVCGDGFVQDTYGEQCDLGSVCDDGITNCTSDPGICPGECRPKITQECTAQCVYSACGDGVLQTPNHDGITEQCDDGNMVPGDGCNVLCEQESCGDGYTDYNGPDNTWFTVDDEECDWNDPAIPSGCLFTCEWEEGYASSNGTCHAFPLLYSAAGDGSSSPSPFIMCDQGVTQDEQFLTGSHTREWYCIGAYGGQTTLCNQREYYCGDGIVHPTYEQCDDGDQLSGDGCSSTCQTELPLVSRPELGGRCALADPVVVQDTEFMPLFWQLQTVDDVDRNAATCTELDQGKYIPGKSLTCTYSLYRGGGENEQPVGVLEGVPCIGDSSTLNPAMLQDFMADHSINPTLVLGSTVIDANAQFDANSYKGRYHAKLEQVDYIQCGRNELLQRVASPIERTAGTLCSYDFTVVTPYLVEEGGTFGSIGHSGLDTFVDGSGQELFEGVIDDTVGLVQLEQVNPEIMRYLVDNFITKNRQGALLPKEIPGISKPLKKVPAKNLFFYEGSGQGDSITIGGQIVDEGESYTLVVVNAKLVIDGSLQGNGLHIVPGGPIQFTSPDCDQRDTVEGMFVTDQGFMADSLHNKEDGTEWCNGGGLTVQGTLLGNGLKGLVKARRSTMAFEDLPHNSIIVAVSGSNHDENFLKTVRKEQSKELLKQAALRIWNDASRRNKLPDGADDLFEALRVYRKR